MKHLVNPEPKAEFKIVSWQNIKKEVKKINPELTEIIENLPSTKKLNFKLATYSYGAIIANGENENIPPIFLVLENTCELFMTQGNQNIPFEIFKPGEICFSGRALIQDTFGMQHTQWAISAGARNVFMLPKISDFLKNYKLQKHFNYEINKPEKLSEQWNSFRLIANSEKAKSDWKCKILIFEDEWFEHLDNKQWKNFYNYLGKTAYLKNQYHSNQFIIPFLLSALQKEKPITLSPPQIEQISHLMMLALNGIPGYAVLTDEELMPLKLIQKIYTDIYKLENYAPIIFGPTYLHEALKSGKSIYYSYRYPCFYSASPKVNKYSTTAKDFYHLLRVFQKAFEFIKNKNLLHTGNLIKLIATTYDFNFYHTGSKIYYEFLSPQQIPENDKSIMKGWPKTKKFPYKAEFLNGCIQIKFGKKAT